MKLTTDAAGTSAAEAERRLVEQAKAGESGAFGELVRNHDKQMRGLAYRLMGDAQLMDDVLQDAYIKAYRSLDLFDVDGDRARFGTWLYRVVYSCCIDDHRKRARRPMLQLVEADPVVGADPADAVIDRLTLRSAMAELSAEHAAVVPRAVARLISLVFRKP